MFNECASAMEKQDFYPPNVVVLSLILLSNDAVIVHSTNHRWFYIFSMYLLKVISLAP